MRLTVERNENSQPIFGSPSAFHKYATDGCAFGRLPNAAVRTHQLHIDFEASAAAAGAGGDGARCRLNNVYAQCHADAQWQALNLCTATRETVGNAPSKKCLSV